MAQFGSTGRGSVNVELNIVPFIDLMSCLVAFLLATAVWVNIAQMRNNHVGKGEDTGPPEPDKPAMSVLVDSEHIYVTRAPDGERRKLDAHDWDGLARSIRELGDKNPMPVEIAADSSREHPVPYESLIAAMDASLKAGYTNVGVVDPRSLTVRP
jgi:biopolymer transport protein ExbD